MPYGSTKVQELSGLTGLNYVIDGATFRKMTKKLDVPLPKTYTFEAGGSPIDDALPRANVVTDMLMTFVGTLTVTAAASGQTQPSPGPSWPYGLLRNFAFTLGGSEHLWDVDGPDIRALNAARHPGFEDHVDVFPGAPNGSSLAAGTYDIGLSWPVGFSLDPWSGVAALAIQSNGVSPQWTASPADVSEVIAAGGTSSLWEITGKVTVSEVAWRIPVLHGKMILPDVLVSHQVIAHESPLVATGPFDSHILRSQGQLERLFLSARADSARNGGSYLTWGVGGDVKSIGWRFGLDERPSTYDPASTLQWRNGQDYSSGPLPYHRVALDQLTRDPVRDAIDLGKLTETRISGEISSTTTLHSGARLRMVEEVLS